MHHKLERGQLLSENYNFRYARTQLQMYSDSVRAYNETTKRLKMKEMRGTFMLGSACLVPLNFALVCQLQQFPRQWTQTCRQLIILNIVMTNWFAMSHMDKTRSYFKEPIERENIN